MNLLALILLVLKISIVLSVLSLGLNAKLSNATFLLRNPRHLLRAFVCVYVLMPLAAVLLCLAFQLHPAVKIALVALSVSPVPPVFPKQALKSGGGEDHAIGLLVALALLAIVVMPVTMEIFERIVDIPLQMPALRVAELVFRTVLAPLLAGIGLRALAPSFAARVAKPIGRLGGVLLLFSVVSIVLGASRAMLSLIGDGTLLSLTVFAVAGWIIGYSFAAPEPANRRILALATASRHPGIAAAIASTNFPDQKLAVPAIVLYLIVSGILTAMFSAWRAKKEKEKAFDTDERRAA